MALERASAAVSDELRKRLGSSFEIAELVALYGEGTDWADAVAASAGAGLEASTAVDAAFGRYSREAVDFSGGRPHFREREAREDPFRGA